jgi:hypothetical protein
MYASTVFALTISNYSNLRLFDFRSAIAIITIKMNASEQVEYKFAALPAAHDYVTRVKEISPSPVDLRAEDIFKFQEITDERTSKEAPDILRGMRNYLDTRLLTPIISQIILDESVAKPDSWRDPDIARTILSMSATFDIAELKVEAKHRSAGKRVQPSELQIATQDFLNTLEEEAPQLPLEERG